MGLVVGDDTFLRQRRKEETSLGLGHADVEVAVESIIGLAARRPVGIWPGL
jgi:hypothetical protein